MLLGKNLTIEQKKKSQFSIRSISVQLIHAFTFMPKLPILLHDSSSHPQLDTYSCKLTPPNFSACVLST